MFHHAPPGYDCPFCRIARGEFGSAGLYTVADDIVLMNQSVVAFVASHWWPKNPGHVLVVPVPHIENMYELSRELSGGIHEATRQIALGMKSAYPCEGISTRQHNEPAGGQDVWHYHLHVFPRFPDDRLYENHAARRFATPAQRQPFASRLRDALSQSRALSR